MTDRDPYLDNAKAILIVAVVMGHFTEEVRTRVAYVRVLWIEECATDRERLAKDPFRFGKWLLLPSEKTRSQQRQAIGDRYVFFAEVISTDRECLADQPFGLVDVAHCNGERV